MMYGRGSSKTGEVIDLGVKAGAVEKSGSWYSFDSQRIGQGRENAKQFLADNPDVAAAIEQLIRDHAGLPNGKSGAAPATPSAEKTDAEKTDGQAEAAGRAITP